MAPLAKKSSFENAAEVEGSVVAEAIAEVADTVAATQEGGKRKRRRTRRKGKKAKKSRKTRKSRKSKTRKKGKRKLNPFFKLMLAAKKAGKTSFKYLGKTYKGRKHPRLGMIYKKSK